MIQIRATKNTPNGVASVLMRFIGKNIFIKKKENSPESMNIINQYKQNNQIKVWESREWIKIDLFGENELIRLGDKEIDKEFDEETKEKLISDFYIDIYKKGGFIVETHGITT